MYLIIQLYVNIWHQYKLTNNGYILEDSIKWLDDMEKNLTDSKITNEEYLTVSTSEGLSVTIRPTVDLTKYILNNCNY